MGDDEKNVARLDERSHNQAERIEKLETNQRWAVIGFIGLIMKQLFDYFGGKI